MNDVLQNKPLSVKGIISTFWDKHSAFFKTIYSIAFYISAAYGFFNWARDLIAMIVEGNFIGFILVSILQTIYLALTAFLGAAVWGTIGVVILFIPYLIIRGFSK